jgi:hypothetical protein
MPAPQEDPNLEAQMAEEQRKRAASKAERLEMAAGKAKRGTGARSLIASSGGGAGFFQTKV